MTVVKLPIASIRTPPRLRHIDRGWVTFVAEALDERGQQVPIIVRPAHDLRQEASNSWGDVVVGMWDLTAGAHRLEAAKKLGWTVIDADIRDESPLEARLTEVDENLLRQELSALARAISLYERKLAWQALHPDGRGGDRRSAKARADQNEHFKTSDRDMIGHYGGFAVESAAKIGLSPKTVLRAVSIAAKLQPVIEQLWETPLEHRESELHALSRVEPVGLHPRIIELVVKGDAATVAEALDQIAGRQSKSQADRLYESLISSWGRAPAETRVNFIAQVPEEELRVALSRRGFKLELDD